MLTKCDQKETIKQKYQQVCFIIHHVKYEAKLPAAHDRHINKILNMIL